MFRKQLPRTYELRDLAAATSSPDAYFLNFEEDLHQHSSALDLWNLWEKQFQGLDESAWNFLKAEAQPRLVERDKLRGWGALFAILNQARAYNYLARKGCKNIRFIPRSRRKTPDLEATLDGAPVLCEVKTINTSEAELKARKKLRARALPIALDDGFFKKLMSDIMQAKEQLEAYDVNGTA